MGDFKQGGGNHFGGNRGGGSGGRGGRPNFQKKSWGGPGGDRGPVTMHKVICDECKKPCEVPFMPTAGKPVYCNVCFGGKRPVSIAGGGRDVSYKTPPRTDFGNDIKKVSGEEIKKQIEVLNVKIDRLVKIIESLVNSQSSSVVNNSAPVLTEAKVKSSKKAVVSKAKKVVKKVFKK